MEGHCSTGQSRQWAVVPMEEEEEEEEEEEDKSIIRIKIAHLNVTYLLHGAESLRS